MLVVLAIGLPARASAESGSTPSDTVRIPDTPRYEIGGSMTDERDQLGRVVDVVLLPDGGVAILDALPGVVRVYDPDGRFLREVGGPGDGPGEFRDPIDLELVDGGLGVVTRGGTLAVFDLDGTLVRSERLGTEGRVSERFNPVPARVVPDGRVLFEARERMFGRPAGEYRQRAALIVDGDAWLDVGVFAADTGRADGTNPVIPRPYTPSDPLLYDASDTRVAVLDPRGLLILRPLDGGAGVTRQLELERPQVTDADVQEARDEMLAPLTGANDRRVVTEWLDGMPRARTAPPARTLLLSDEAVWIERWRRVGARSAWLRTDLEGHPLGELLGPVGVELRDVRGGWVTGIATDEFGLQRVRTYRIETGPGR